MAPREIKPADGKMLVFFVGMGAITSTVLTGIFNIRKGLHKPIGSLTQMGHIRLGKRTENRSPLIKEFVPLANINDLACCSQRGLGERFDGSIRAVASW